MMNIPIIDLALTDANIVRLRKSAGLSVADIQIVFGFHSPQAIYKWQSGAALPTVDKLHNKLVFAGLFWKRAKNCRGGIHASRR